MAARCELSSLASRASCRTPQGSHRRSAEFLESGKAGEEAGPRQAREHAVVRSDDGMEGAGVIARGFLRRRVVPLVEVDFPAARAKALAYGSAGKARADDGGLSRPSILEDLWPFLRVPRDEHVSLARRTPGVSRRRSRSLAARAAPPRRCSRWRRWRPARRAARWRETLRATTCRRSSPARSRRGRSHRRRAAGRAAP